MRSCLPAAAYIDETWFARERELLFRPLWQFAGLLTMLRKHNDFINRKLCGVPVVVQNFDGELRAFENLCLHRQNPLQTAAQGTRPLVCSYHGWGYDTQGAAANIPFESEVYRYPPEERAGLRLRRFALETVGNLVFVNMAPEPMALHDQFSDELLDSLAQVSEAFDDETILTTFKLKCNWKLVYENLRDAHHPRYVHTQSIYKNVRFGVAMDEEAIAASKQLAEHGIADRETAMRHLRDFSNGGLNEAMESLPDYGWHRNVERFGDRDWYYNWLVYPNLHIASGSGGYSFIIEHHVPVSAGRTDLIVHYVTAKKRARYATSAAVLYEHMLGGARVLREDIRVMEDIQATLHADSPRACLGDFEHANAGIERWYADVIDGNIGL
jgi:phenylpropionate dioxygenase-like ring-hydroxylating dioxygenase large terminal subunit